MTQKILAGRADDPSLLGDLVRVKVDQVVLSREPNRPLVEALEAGMKRVAVETAVAYETRCITAASDPRTSNTRVTREALSPGVLVARPGIGFSAPVHLERFAGPARLAVTDEPRLAAVGGIGMLTLTVSPTQLVEALMQGTLFLRPPRSVQVLLSGRVRPFVCIRDVALELVRRGLAEIIQKIDAEQRAPVVLEFAGPSARLLSVPERAILCALAPTLGAAGAIFVSDEKTEVYLRDQRRSKAHRVLVPDPGTPCDDVISLDLSAVDPLVMDRTGVVRPVRELADEPVSQVVLGGDTGASLRDLLAAATLLKSKRVPERLDFLLSPPSRQTVEVLAQAGALVDLMATGARLVEPDHRLLSGELYVPEPGGLSLRTYDPEPGISSGFVVASAETIAYAVATGEVGDPRNFKRPVRITVPRSLPTDDVLVVRKGKGKGKGDGELTKQQVFNAPTKTLPWSGGATLQLISAASGAGGATLAAVRSLAGPSALVCDSLDTVSWVARHAPALLPGLRAVIAPHIPSGTVPVFAGLGILALVAEPSALQELSRHGAVELPGPELWNGDGIRAPLGASVVKLRLIALGAEREWTAAGTARCGARAVRASPS